MDYQQAWQTGYDEGHDLMLALRRKALSSVELRQMGEGVGDLILQAADDLEQREQADDLRATLRRAL